MKSVFKIVNNLTVKKMSKRQDHVTGKEGQLTSIHTKTLASTQSETWQLIFY